MLSNENFEGEMKMKINIAELTSKMSDKIMEILWWFLKPLLKMPLTFLMIALTTSIYCVGYVYDAFLGDSFIRYIYEIVSPNSEVAAFFLNKTDKNQCTFRSP